MVSTEYTLREFRAWCRWLREHFPVEYPVTFRRASIKKKHCAEAWVYESRRGRPKAYHVKLDEKLDRVGIQDALIHEWTHVLRSALGGNIETHDAEFWKQHGRVYRKWHETK